MAVLIAPQKITHYLLTDRTADAAGKNAFFTAIGFTAAAWQTLEAALRAHPQLAALEWVEPDTGYGEKHVFRCHLPPAPNGRLYCIRSVWMRRGKDLHFVTAYPQPPQG